MKGFETTIKARTAAEMGRSKKECPAMKGFETWPNMQSVAYANA